MKGKWEKCRGKGRKMVWQGMGMKEEGKYCGFLR